MIFLSVLFWLMFLVNGAIAAATVSGHWSKIGYLNVLVFFYMVYVAYRIHAPQPRHVRGGLRNPEGNFGSCNPFRSTERRG